MTARVAGLGFKELNHLFSFLGRPAQVKDDPFLTLFSPFQSFLRADPSRAMESVAAWAFASRSCESVLSSKSRISSAYCAASERRGLLPATNPRSTPYRLLTGTVAHSGPEA